MQHRLNVFNFLVRRSGTLLPMQWAIGIDEAGRGPLAGPVAVGVFAVPDTFDFTHLANIRDSKTLSEKQREKWFDTLNALPHTRHAVSLVDAQHIDTYGIVHAIRTAMEQALSELALAPKDCTVLLDGGLHAPEAYTDQTTIVKGDATEPVISAAAMLAKVTRDRFMIAQAETFPRYEFERHKGYGTKAHRDAIQQHGLTVLHRKSYCTNWSMLR